ncbi:NUDIX hydrolase [Isoptericola sp. NEAU-Y5]|uniref:NUDIX hydrolase n=1 Tax=Isoptericola luteus TaxID=2879484 RepID=A0ABS7ZBC8_9MICO|nr:NUDIX hydrolase [Isoptericola sp. NEAU-Y5]MCA5892353.1 NUDIX hydrolase [Isoptericola sp. NEAU-Y5]
MPSRFPPTDVLHRHAGDGWVTCGDHQHWGTHGAAGLLLARRGDAAAGPLAGPVTHVVLQHRALWSDQGGTWGVPGGALAPGESPEAGALRESLEEAAIPPGAVHVLGTHVLDHGPWAYTTVVADVTPGAVVRPAPADPESLEVRWVAVDELATLPLLPAFAAAWPRLHALLG